MFPHHPPRTPIRSFFNFLDEDPVMTLFQRKSIRFAYNFIGDLLRRFVSNLRHLLKCPCPNAPHIGKFAHFEGPGFGIVSGTWRCSEWFACACIVASVLRRCHYTYIKILASGFSLDSPIFYRLRRNCRSPLRNPKKEPCNVTSLCHFEILKWTECLRAWASFSKRGVSCLGSFQLLLTRMNEGQPRKSHIRGLKYINLYSMEKREFSGGMIKTYKILKSLTFRPMRHVQATYRGQNAWQWHKAVSRLLWAK